MKIVIDGKDTILGRLASFSAKQALLGKEVIIVNCAGVVLTGNKRMIIEEYKKTVYRGGHSLKGPFHNKTNPERFVKRAIRGMLSYKMGRGEKAFDKIRCYSETPKEYASEKKMILPYTKSNSFTIKELIKEI